VQVFSLWLAAFSKSRSSLLTYAKHEALQGVAAPAFLLIRR
jgi:hypothetical protein